MNSAEQLFNDTFRRILNAWRVVGSFRTVADVGQENARSALHRRYLAYTRQLVEREPQLFQDVEKLLEQLPPEKMAEMMADNAIRDFSNSVVAASVVFTHSVIDDAALAYCRATALAAPKDWESYVINRKVELAELRAASFDQTFTSMLDTYFEELAQKPLLKKADLLFERCQPPKQWAPIERYNYDRDRLEKFDKLRHEIVHGDALRTQLRVTAEDWDFLEKTPMFFMLLVNYKYHLQLDSQYVFTTLQPRTA